MNELVLVNREDQARTLVLGLGQFLKVKRDWRHQDFIAAANKFANLEAKAKLYGDVDSNDVFQNFNEAFEVTESETQEYFKSLGQKKEKAKKSNQRLNLI